MAMPNMAFERDAPKAAPLNFTLCGTGVPENMNSESLLPIFFFAIFTLVVGSFLYKMLKHGGFKAAMFGAPIERTVGEVAGGGVKLMNVGVKVHKLGGGREKAVGVELVAKSFASYQMMPVTLSAAEARKLIVLLEAATVGQNAT